MLDKLKRKVCRANIQLFESQLVTLTWGNASGFDPQKKLVVIKPSGMAYDDMRPEFMVVVDFKGAVVEGDFRPSSDTAAHIELYKAFNGISSVVHTHSDYASMFAQAFKEIPCLGTTHADFFNGPVPVTRALYQNEVERDYEKNTGKVIVERFKDLDHLALPAVLVAGHGPFIWGRNPEEAVETGIALEKIAKMAWGTLALKPEKKTIPDYVLKKHYFRMHGSNAYYGQKEGDKND
jgi:L-ribulose-5-phosphate 4-epimerase